MRKFLFVLFASVMLTACGAAYNTQLKQVQLGMTENQIVTLMGSKYTVVEEKDASNRTIEYKDRYKNYWIFVFVDGKLNKWYKEVES
ncbi:MAG: hypothetical protein ACK5MK_00175 [Dysgonomonas sp.]